MKAFTDRTGQTYGRLTAIYPLRKNNQIYWHCKCSCGNEVDVSGKCLQSGNTKSCGCLQKEKASKTSLIDLTGEVFGNLTVLCRDDSKPKGHGKPVFWICKCICGNTCSVQGTHLKTGHTKSCGCYKPIQPNFINEVGNRYGLLTVIEEYGRNSEGRVLWKCKCDCGNEKITLGKSLRAGLVLSCGCLHSKGEQKINRILTENNIDFVPQYSYSDLRSPKGMPLYFDFYLPQYNVVIEYQGEQHYSPTRLCPGEKFNELQERDNLKRDYCNNHNIKLIEIPYTDYSILDGDYLKEMIL